MTYYYGYSSSRVSEAVLPKTMQQFLLPKLAATQRLARVGERHLSPAGVRRPSAAGLGRRAAVAVPSGHPGRRRAAVLDPQRPVVSPRSDETLPVQAPRTIFKQGLVLLDDRIAPLEAGGSAWMIEALRKTPRWKCRTSDRWELLRRLWQLPSGPEMNVPDNLRAEEVQLPPQGRLMIDKPERYDPYRLPGRVDFLYDGKAVSAQETVRGIVDERAGADPGPRPAARTRAGRVAGCPGHSAHGGLAGREVPALWIPSQKLPEAVEALVAEGWIVEAQGYLVRRAGTWRMNVTSGVDWFDLAGTLDFDGMEVQLPGDPRGPPPRPELRAAEGRLAGPACRRSGWRASPRWPNWARRKARPSAFARRRPCCWTPCWRPRSKSPSMRPSPQLREKLRIVQRRRPGRRAAGVQRRVAAVPEDRAGLAALPAGLPPRRLPGRRHGPGQDGPGAGHAARAARAARRRRRPAGAFAGRGAPQPGLQLDRGGQAVHARTCGCWTTPACSAARLADNFDQYDLVVTTYGTMQRDIVKLKDIRFDYAILDESQAIKNAHSQRAKASRLLKADHRLAMTGTPGGEPSGRALVAAGVPQPGHARHGVGVPGHLEEGLRGQRGAGAAPPRAGAVHPPPHQAAGA